MLFRSTICVEEDFAYDEEKALAFLQEYSPEIAECLRDKTGEVRILRQEREKFILSTGGGKVRSVVDRRTPA